MQRVHESWRRSDLVLLVAAVLAGAFLFSSLDSLWPLAPVDVTRDPGIVESEARAFLRERGVLGPGASAAASLVVDEDLLDYLQRTFGLEATRAMIGQGRPVYRYLVLFKRAGDPDLAYARVDPRGGVVAWWRTFQEDAPGARVTEDAARRLASVAVAGLGIDLTGWTLQGVAAHERPARRDHVFTWERELSEDPELRERIWVQVAGVEIGGVERRLIVPESGVRAARRRAAPTNALGVGGAIAAAIAGLVALALFLTHLRRGTVALRPAATLVGAIAIGFLVIQALRPADLLREWDPLWPRWIATFQSLAMSAAGGAWVAFALFVVVAAGDALDRESGARRGASLWLAAAGKLTHPAVGLASIRGFLVGLLSGAALSASIALLARFAGGWAPIQPQGFFFYALNSSAPAVSTLVFFLMVALVEELGYRFFAGTWLLQWTGHAWIAVIIPAMLYGATHTGLQFLPPGDPFWGRAVALTVVGCVWGWAFLRYDALTVALSHFTADLFIFNWPRLASGDPDLVLRAIATIAVPLVPGVLWLAAKARARAVRADA